MWTLGAKAMNRRELLTRTAPACALGCLGWLNSPDALAAGMTPPPQEVHKFDRIRDVELSPRISQRMQYSRLLSFIQHLRGEIGDEALIQVLNRYSTALGQRQGEQQAARLPDTEFRTFIAQFRPESCASRLTVGIVEDTEDTIEIRVTECIWASLFQEAGLDGELGYAAVCNMDYTWATAFNPAFRLERNKTLMQGDDHCNHRYTDTRSGK